MEPGNKELLKLGCIISPVAILLGTLGMKAVFDDPDRDPNQMEQSQVNGGLEHATATARINDKGQLYLESNGIKVNTIIDKEKIYLEPKSVFDGTNLKNNLIKKVSHEQIYLEPKGILEGTNFGKKQEKKTKREHIYWEPKSIFHGTSFYKGEVPEAEKWVDLPAREAKMIPYVTKLCREDKYCKDSNLVLALLKQESGFQCGVISKNPKTGLWCGAVGEGQLMPGTARGEGLDTYKDFNYTSCNHEKTLELFKAVEGLSCKQAWKKTGDDRFHSEKNIKGMVRHLFYTIPKGLGYDVSKPLKSWQIENCLAAYYTGVSNVKKHKGVPSWARGYVNNILSMKRQYARRKSI
ncbi:lytic transglycosylase domain-containing protein [Nanoarchaeota archaeon]